MRQKEFYINGIGIISPQKTFDNALFLTEITEYDKNVLSCVVPDFREYINPIQLRRLSRMLRIGLSAATICLRDAGVKVPDGIITSTGYGFLDETAKFLHELLQQQERQLTPTYFMQSTYNALAGLVALSVKCMGYNNTYVSKGFAFENALHDAMMQLQDRASENFLIGAYDEASDVQYKANIRAGHYKTTYISNFQLFETESEGSIQGEGSAFFSISGVGKGDHWCRLIDAEILFNPSNELKLSEALSRFLRKNNAGLEEIDLWIDGSSGDSKHDRLLKSLRSSLLKNTSAVRFKHLCGEYCTASAFALWLGASMLRKQQIPDIVRTPFKSYPPRLKQILILNQYMGRNYSFMLLKK
jgi:hypothetical protein